MAATTGRFQNITLRAEPVLITDHISTRVWARTADTALTDTEL